MKCKLKRSKHKLLTIYKQCMYKDCIHEIYTQQLLSCKHMEHSERRVKELRAIYNYKIARNKNLKKKIFKLKGCKRC